MGIRKYRIHKTVPVMNLLFNRIVFVGVAITAFLFFSCEEKLEYPNLLLNENEMCFNEKLISITQNGSDYYIGTESSGRIYVYSLEMNNIDTLYTECGRVYRVKQAKEANTFYVGTQNMGLKKAHKKGDYLITDTTFFIKGKSDRYSCYDVFIDNGVVYAMTSHGIFNVVKSDTLSSIYSDDDENRVPKPFVASNMAKADDGSLFAATAKGLVRVRGNSVDTIIENKNVYNVVYHDNYIFALSDSLYRIAPGSLKIDKYALKSPAKYYYYTDSIHFFLSNNYLILTHNDALQKPEQQKRVNTRRRISIEGHNVIADSKDFSLLITDHALWQISHHLPSVFGKQKEGGVKLACTNGNAVFFLVGKKVYIIEVGNVMKEILELKEKGEIKYMECSSDSIYYVNSEDSVFRQGFGQDKPELMGNSPKPKEITAMCRHESVTGVILGIRDGLISMDKTNVKKDITLRILDHKDTIPYIRRFAAERGRSIYYAPTMNEGLFYGHGTSLELVPGTDTLQSILDVAYSRKGNLHPYILTNKDLFLSNGKNIDNKNHGSRLLVSLSDSGRVYIPGEVGGVRTIILDKDDNIQTDTILFPDIAFRAESCVLLGDTVYLAGQSGVIALSYKNGKFDYYYPQPEDKENDAFYPKLITLLLVVTIVVAVFLLLKKRIITRKSKDAKNMAEEKANDINTNVNQVNENNKQGIKRQILLSQQKYRHQKQQKNSEKPRETMTFGKKSGVLEGHLSLLYQKLSKEGWIEGNEADFKALFSSKRDEDCKLTWKGKYGKGTLVELFKQLVNERLITVPKGFTIPSILEGHFVDLSGVWLTGLDKGNSANSKANPVIEECKKVLKVDISSSYQDDEESQTEFDPYNHQDMHLHKR